jgi:antibiotic biosynthesis monooxygenase (ABM) superfamily enzyme
MIFRHSRSGQPPDEKETMAQESSIKSRGPVAAHPVTSAIITILTIAVVFFAVYVPLYARATPKVGDFPFFYFYLLIYMPVVSIVCWIIVTLQKRLRPPGNQRAPQGSGGAR